MGRWVLQKFVYKLLLKRLANAKSKHPRRPISRKTPAVSNYLLYIKMYTTESTKHLFNLTIFSNVSDKNDSYNVEMDEYANM